MVIGVISGLRRHRAATAILLVWTLSVIASALLLALWPYPRYFAAAMVPLSAFVALGGVAVWNGLSGRSLPYRSARIAVAAVLLLVAVSPALRYEGQVLADPVHTVYPGADLEGYVWATSAQTWVDPFAKEIERRGGPYPVHVDVVLGYTWGLDLRLNGAAVGSARRYDVFSGGTPAQRAGARYLVTDGARSDAPPRPGYHLVDRRARMLGGAVTRLYVRD